MFGLLFLTYFFIVVLYTITIKQLSIKNDNAE
ncbi:uncharacterized protein METZ01_LOCUS305287 [marine metagenome]|uniref:Uncharacterized protein n=1 Tax=marine metagenome TaxID=408172 RepID=A0A382MTX2_9ZZZZ